MHSQSQIEYFSFVCFCSVAPDEDDWMSIEIRLQKKHVKVEPDPGQDLS